MATKITRDVLEAYLNCKTKAHLKLLDQQGSVSEYEALLISTRQEVRQQAIGKILARCHEGEVARDITLTAATLLEGPSFVLDATLEDDLLSLSFDGLKRVDGPSKLGDFHYIPMMFYEGCRIRKQQRLLLDLYGLFLSDLQGRKPDIGIIWHGKGSRAMKVRLRPDRSKAGRILEEIRRARIQAEPPRLILNDHCHCCEFRQRCLDQANQEDNISLLRGIGEKEVKRYARKGILTVTQLAHTFRPVRRGKRAQPKGYRHHHALQALAIRDRRVYVYGTPQLPASPVHIYLDVEGYPDERFDYLIGMVIVEKGGELRYSFWADDQEQEWQIFEQFLSVVNRYDNFLVFCYGGYEKDFLTRMRRHAKRKKDLERVMKSLVNVLSLVYTHFYFPTFSNGLKEVAGCLGCSWSESGASGVQSIVWRTRWQATHEERWKDKLTAYNLEDCSALRRVTEFIYAAIAATDPEGSRTVEGGPPISLVDEIDRLGSEHRGGRIRFFHPDFEYVRECAYFDYQRQRVFVRTSKVLKQKKKRARGYENQRLRVNRRIEITSSKCPKCGGTEIIRWSKGKKVTGHPRVKRVLDLVFTPSGIKRIVIECRAPAHECTDCGNTFMPDKYLRAAKHSHALMSWAMFEYLAHRTSNRVLEDMFRQYFSLTVSKSEIHTFKSLMSRYYRVTYKRLLAKILSGKLLHVDETEIRLHTGKGYVWVFTNLEEVVFMYRPSREGDFLQKLLKDFHGVLVSDFYSAYDSINCPQQKCIIHLMRDMNENLLNHPFDEELQSITGPFGKLLRDIVATIDQHGLRQSPLKKHEQAVANYFHHLRAQIFRSESAEALRERLTKYQDKLFTFMKYDGVPWNNNNAENAIKQFVYFREHTDGIMSEAGLEDYLVLLSVCQTCKYRGISFFKFLLSRERDIDAFSDGRRARQSSTIEVYPKGFTPFSFSRSRSKAAEVLETPNQGESHSGP
jgi:predicted RecB family nuclease